MSAAPRKMKNEKRETAFVRPTTAQAQCMRVPLIDVPKDIEPCVEKSTPSCGVPAAWQRGRGTGKRPCPINCLRLTACGWYFRAHHVPVHLT